MVGGDYIDRTSASLADDGRLVNIAFQQGSTATIDFMRVMLKRLTLTGSTLRVRTSEVKAAHCRTMCRANVLCRWSPRGGSRCSIDSTYPLADAADAHARMEASQHIGKIVLTVG